MDLSVGGRADSALKMLDEEHETSASAADRSQRLFSWQRIRLWCS
jgi:hypothetical protein